MGRFVYNLLASHGGGVGGGAVGALLCVWVWSRPMYINVLSCNSLNWCYYIHVFLNVVMN